MKVINRILLIVILMLIVIGTIVIYGNYFSENANETIESETSESPEDENETSSSTTVENSEGETMAEFASITMEEAKEIFATEGDYIILDVRRADEYAGGHIPNAINVANEDIALDEVEELPDLDQTIYVYCRSGRRSKEAARKLSVIGYTNIIECGGIIDWTGELEY